MKDVWTEDVRGRYREKRTFELCPQTLVVVALNLAYFLQLLLGCRREGASVGQYGAGVPCDDWRPDDLTIGSLGS